MNQAVTETSHFVWEGYPVIFETGVLPLPFTLSIHGIFLGIILAMIGLTQWQKKINEGVKSARKQKELSNGQYWLVVLSAMAIGQLVFNLVIPVDGWQQLGPIEFRWYGILFGTAFFIGYLIGSREFSDYGRPEAERDALLTYVLIATVIGARLGEVLFYDPAYYFSNPILIPQIWRGGLASHGAAIGILIGIYLYTRKYPHLSYLWVTDRVVIPVAIGGVFVRLGNFFNSEIYGIPTNVPWAVIFASEDPLPRHPTMLYEAFAYLVLFFILWSIYKRFKGRPPEGLIFGVFLIIMFTARFLLEYTKVEQADFATDWFIGMGQILSIPFVLLGIWMLWKRVDYSGVRPSTGISSQGTSHG